MNVSLNNINKPTPTTARNIGNAIIFMALAVQPLINDAGDDIMTHRMKFWLSFFVALVGAGVKGYTMLLSNEPPSE